MANRPHPLISLIQIDIYLGQNKIDLALNTISPLQRIMPENRSLAYKLAEVLIRQQQPKQVIKLVQRFTNNNPRDVYGWHLMQQAAALEPASALKAVNVLRYRAEVEYWSGEEEAAIKSMLHAQRLAKIIMRCLPELMRD